jgi:hypothetical protein
MTPSLLQVQATHHNRFSALFHACSDACSAADLCHHAPAVHASSSTGQHRHAGQPMHSPPSHHHASHQQQLIFVCLEVLGAVPCFTLYAAVRRVLPCCQGSAGAQTGAGCSSVLNVFVASKADALISFSKVDVTCDDCSPLLPSHSVMTPAAPQVCSYASAIAGCAVAASPASLQLQVLGPWRLTPILICVD